MQASKPNLKLVVGLGNPGPQYANTYHNAGALFAEDLKKYRDKILDSQRLINYRLAIPTSTAYVNDSGTFVMKMMKKYNTEPENLLIAHDDSDLEIGKYKLTFGQSAAGHHGVESIQTTLKTKGFWRLRIGIRPAKETVRQKAEAFVLKKISAENQKLLKETFEKAAAEIIQ